MSSHASLARRWFEEVWVPGGEETVHELMAEHVIGHMEAGVDIHGREEFLIERRKFLEAFPDLSIVADDVIEEGSKVVVRWRASATYRGDRLAPPVSTRQQSFRGMTWLEFENGQIVLGWDSWNLGALLQSLNVASAT
jgi:steroid delta-isomerase-like uncharacterized protein